MPKSFTDRVLIEAGAEYGKERMYNILLDWDDSLDSIGELTFDTDEKSAIAVVRGMLQTAMKTLNPMNNEELQQLAQKDLESCDTSTDVNASNEANLNMCTSSLDPV